MDKVVRRLELLKLEGLGFSQAEIVNELSQNYYHAIARDEKEAGVLIDQGFQYVCTTPQGVMIFRKRK